MDDLLAFGIGCFHFGVKKTPPFKLEGSEYIEKLRGCLESIPNIDRITINCDEEFEKVSFDVEDELPNLQTGHSFFPRPNFMSIEFEAYIPFRIQAELLEEKVEFLETFTENFKVGIHYTYDLPVAFVETVEPSQKNWPSQAVRIVREFIEQEFERYKSDYIRFECLGPSPFHADCYIQPEETESDAGLGWEFEAKRVPKKGYDEIIFNFNQKMFEDKNEAKDAIMEEIQDELGFFYGVVRSEVERMFNWEPLQDSVTKLVGIQRMKGIKGVWKRMFVRSKLINECFTTIAEFEARDLISNNITQISYRDIYLDREKEYFQSYIDKKMKELFIYPTKETRELISFFESRRVKSVEVFVVLISAVVGGVIGALLTKLFSG